eukprot:g8334.t1
MFLPSTHRLAKPIVNVASTSTIYIDGVSLRKLPAYKSTTEQVFVAIPSNLAVGEGNGRIVFQFLWNGALKNTETFEMLRLMLIEPRPCSRLPRTMGYLLYRAEGLPLPDENSAVAACVDAAFNLYDTSGPAPVGNSLVVIGVTAVTAQSAEVKLDWPHTPTTANRWNTEKFIVYYAVTSNTLYTSPDWAAEKNATKARLQRWMNTFPNHKCGTICQANWGKGPAADISATVTSFNCVHDVAAMHKKMATYANWGSTPGSPLGDQYNYNGIKEGLSLPFVAKQAGETTSDWLKSNYATTPNPTSYMWSNNASGFCLNLDPENTTGATAYVDGAFEYKILVGAGFCGYNGTYSDCSGIFSCADFVSGRYAYFAVLPVFSVRYYGSSYTSTSKLVYGTSFSGIAETLLVPVPSQMILVGVTVASSTSITVTWQPVVLNGASNATVTVECSDTLALINDPSNNAQRYFLGSANYTPETVTLDRPFQLVFSNTYYCKAYATSVGGSSVKSDQLSVKFVWVPEPPSTAPTLTVVSPNAFDVSFVIQDVHSQNGGENLVTLLLDKSLDGSNWQSLRNFTKTDPSCNWKSGALISCRYTVEGLTANSAYYVRYRAENVKGKGNFSATTTETLPPGPSINALSLTSSDLDVTAGVAQATSTSGGAVLTLTGNNFQRFGTVVSVEMDRCCGLAALPLTVNPSLTTDSKVVFVLPASVGTGLNFVVKSGPISSAPSSDSVSYPQPTYADNSLHRPGSLPTEPATPLPALSQQAELLVFNGQHFGNDANAVKVTYRGPTKNFTCTVQTVSNTEIQCLTQPSSNGETGLVFYISIGEQVVTGTDIYNYPSLPLVDSISVSGCTACTNIKYTCGCPTSGLNSTGSPVTLTISGSKLSPPLEVFVAGKQCADVSFSGTFPAAVVTCKLPTGAGFNQETVLAQSGLRASSKPFVSYAAPSVQSVSGCVNKKDCKRKSPTDAITITGTDFGFSGARAFVGGNICNSTSHVNGTEYSRILCKMPEGFGLNLVISVYQLEGEISQETNVTVSYAQCLEGTYREGLNCPSCPKGSANNALDQLSCPLCLSGRFANASGMLNCVECPAGYFSGQNASACSSCPPGKFSVEGDPTCTALSISPSESISPSVSVSPSESISPLVSVLPSETPSSSPSPDSESPSCSLTASETPSVILTASETPIVSLTTSETPSVSLTASETPSVSLTASRSRSASVTPSRSVPRTFCADHDGDCEGCFGMTYPPCIYCHVGPKKGMCSLVTTSYATNSTILEAIAYYNSKCQLEGNANVTFLNFLGLSTNNASTFCSYTQFPSSARSITSASWVLQWALLVGLALLIDRFAPAATVTGRAHDQETLYRPLLVIGCASCLVIFGLQGEIETKITNFSIQTHAWNQSPCYE